MLEEQLFFKLHHLDRSYTLSVFVSWNGSWLFSEYYTSYFTKYVAEEMWFALPGTSDLYLIKLGEDLNRRRLFIALLYKHVFYSNSLYTNMISKSSEKRLNKLNSLADYCYRRPSWPLNRWCCFSVHEGSGYIFRTICATFHQYMWFKNY